MKPKTPVYVYRWLPTPPHYILMFFAGAAYASFSYRLWPWPGLFRRHLKLLRVRFRAKRTE